MPSMNNSVVSTDSESEFLAWKLHLEENSIEYVK